MAIKTPQGSIVDLPRGTSDFNTKDSIVLKEIMSVAEEVFKRYGFSPIHTPSIENTEVLNAKAYGAEQTKEMYIIEGGDVALRFDLTVPLARYMAMNKDIALPFKRYQIGNVWRKDEPQRMREREFMQADIDIVGSKDPQSDAECVAAASETVHSIGLDDFKIVVNSRGILTAILSTFNITAELLPKAIIIIDKMAKTSVNDTTKDLVKLGMDQQSAEKLVNLIMWGTTNDEKMAHLEINIPDSKPEIEKLREFLAILGNYDVKGEIKVDFSLARGLNYYTGIIFEFTASIDGQKTPSIAGGGRYDNLIGMYSKTPTPAVGISLGISRIFELLKNKAERRSYARIFIANIGKENVPYSIEIAKKLRQSAIYTDINVTERGVSKQLEYANYLGVKYVAIVGNKEKEANQVKLRDMTTGNEELIDIDTLISRLKT